jgi:hypothetical protein
MPHGYVERLEKAKITVHFIDTNLVRLGMQDTTVIGKWYKGFRNGSFVRYDEAVTAWKNPATRTKIIIDEVRAAEKIFVPEYRKLAALMKTNQAASDADLDAAGLPMRSAGKHSPAPVAAMPPGFEIIPLAGHRLHIDYFSMEERSKGNKPKGQHGAEIKWTFSEVDVDDPDLYEHSGFDTASPAILTFRGSEMGHKIHIALRWENTRGLKGPWSTPVETVIP